MARVIVKRNDVPQMYVNDLENRSQRNPPYETEGQTRYIGSIVAGNGNGRYETLAAYLASIGATESVATLLAATVAINDVRTTTIDTAIASVATSLAQEEAIQNLLSYRFVETGPLLLSFDRGVLEEIKKSTWTHAGVAAALVVVLKDDGITPFTL